jgi:L-threonylcarbamoyladenylate synthase
VKKDIDESLHVLQNSGTILYPTDTVWGIGCDATNREAIQKIFNIKQRDQNKSLILLLDRIERLPSYIELIPDIAFDLIEQSFKPLTIIYPRAKNLPDEIIHEDGSIAIRITDDLFCKKLIFRLRKPLVSTSANISGEAAPSIFEKIDTEIKSSVDYIVQHRRHEFTSSTRPSGIIKVMPGNVVEVIRK